MHSHEVTVENRVVLSAASLKAVLVTEVDRERVVELLKKRGLTSCDVITDWLSYGQLLKRISNCAHKDLFFTDRDL